MWQTSAVDDEVSMGRAPSEVTRPAGAHKQRNGMSISIPEVTLFAATSVALDATVEALRTSMSEAGFARTILFSDRSPEGADLSGIDVEPIAKMSSKADYSRFMLHGLGPHITTSHALCVQWDGYVLNGQAWRPEFLQYDYIGAPWPHFRDGHNVGNGGFSLRSKRLLEATAKLPFDRAIAEDVQIGRVHRSRLETEGLRFAPAEIAAQFSFERTKSSGGEFGFHGVFNMVKLRRPGAMFSILKSLEPQVLSHNEHKELLRWAVGRGYLRLASLLVSRIMQQRNWSTDT